MMVSYPLLTQRRVGKAAHARGAQSGVLGDEQVGLKEPAS